MKAPSFDGVQERMERKKAEYAEKLRNKEAEIHKRAGRKQSST